MSQLFKTFAVNASISWHIFEGRVLIQSAERFKSLDSFRAALDRVQSTADFMLDARLRFFPHHIGWMKAQLVTKRMEWLSIAMSAEN